MREIRLHNQQFQLERNYPMPSVDKDEVLVKVRLAAICGTDLELARGYYDFDGVPGHECGGNCLRSRTRAEGGRRYQHGMLAMQ